jgi:transcriptional antiterminator/mannitol/fructose-specific phosphotransferase system IIA component (Ntr-type)
MELNKKCLEILQYIRNERGFIKVEEISKRFKLTDRAIRYNLDKIERFLVKNGFDYFERQHSKGMRLVQSKKLEDFIDRFASTNTPYKYIYSKDERVEFITTKLLQAAAPLKISYFEKELSCSKNTIMKELSSIEEWLKERNILLIRRQKIGILTEGLEIDKRKAIMEIVSKSIKTEDMFSFMNNKFSQAKINNLQMNNLFSDIKVDFLDNLIKMCEAELNKEFSDETYSNMITHLSIMIKRIQLNKKLYLPDLKSEGIKETREYTAALNLTRRIETYYNIRVPEEEVDYIALHLLGAKVLNMSHSSEINESDFNDLSIVVKNMVSEIERVYNVDFGVSQENLVSNLVLHLRPTIYRIKYNLKLVNPLFEEIRTNYKDLFHSTKYVARYLEDYIGEKIDDQEISYIALHFGAALENLKDKTANIAKIILVCGTGIGTSNMLASKLTKEFCVEIVSTISVRTINTIKAMNYDYIISTIDIPQLDKTQYVKINPLILKSDYITLESFLQTKYKSLHRQNDELQFINRLLNIVERYSEIHDREQLQYEFLYEMRHNNEYILERRFEYMLKDLLCPEVIRLNIACSDWNEAVKAGTNMLLERGCIDNSYEKAIIKNFKELGPYMVVAPGIALCHARPEDGVKKLSMSLITLRDPVKFGSEMNDPVKLIITLAAVDNDSHLRALSQLMELLMNTEDLKTVQNAKNREEVIEIINRHSK